MGIIMSADRFLAEHERSPYSTRAIASMMNRDAAHASDKLVTRWLEELSYGRFDPSGETRRRWSQPAPSSYREAIAYEEEHAWPDNRMPVSEADRQALAILGLWDLLIGLGVPVFHDDARGSLRKASELAEAARNRRGLDGRGRPRRCPRRGRRRLRAHEPMLRLPVAAVFRLVFPLVLASPCQRA
jgi:hypothetical protein